MTLDILLSILCGILAIIVVVGPNPLVSAFSLLSMFVIMAGIFFQLGSSFLAAIQVLVYAGAIAILFIFVLMLLNIDDLKKVSVKTSLKPIIGIIATLILLGVFSIIITNNIDYLSRDNLIQTDMTKLFQKLFEKYLVPFELATMLLLGAVVATISMLKKNFQKEKLDSP